MSDKIILHPLKGKMTAEELDEMEALMILSSIPQVGLAKMKTLMHHFGSARSALLAPSNEILALPGFGKRMENLWEKRFEETAWKQNLIAITECKATAIPYFSPQYPKRLLEIADAPMILYIRGTLLPQDARSIAIVGTRQASIYGLEMAKRFASDLAGMGFTIVSGLARGIDTAAHLGALERGRTVAVIGSGLGDIYPPENHVLAERIANHGAVMSEFSMLTPPDRHNFPRRNRIVSGMTLATLLIEAPLKSGAMITMEQAEAQKRLLFALPGRIDCENFRGNHFLIKKNRRAHLVESAEEIASHFDQFFKAMAPPKEEQISQGALLNADEETLWKLLPSQELSVEKILLLSQMPVSALNVLLMKLVLKGRVKEFPGKVYMKIGAAK